MLSSAGTAALGLGYWIIAARLYTPNVVGQNAAALSAMQLAAAPCWAGQYAILIRYLPTAAERSGKLIVACYATSVAAAIPLALMALVIGPRLASSLEVISSDPAWATIFVASTALWAVFALQDAAMIAMRQARWVPLENILYAAAKLALLAVLVEAAPVHGIFVSWNAPIGVMVALVSWLIFQRLAPHHSRERECRLPHPGQLVRYGVANWAGTLLTLLPLTLIPLLVASQLGSRANAYFFVPWSIATSLTLIASSMTTAVTVEGAFDSGSLRRAAREAARHTAVLLVPLVLIVGLGAPTLLRVVGSDYSSHGANLLRLLLVAALPNAVIQFAVSVARVRRQHAAIVAIQGLAACLAIGLCLLLIPHEGIAGAGLAWLLAQALVAAVACIWVFHRYPARRSGALGAGSSEC